jgi:hypothetical protein
MIKLAARKDILNYEVQSHIKTLLSGQHTKNMDSWYNICRCFSYPIGERCFVLEMQFVEVDELNHILSIQYCATTYTKGDLVKRTLTKAESVNTGMLHIKFPFTDDNHINIFPTTGNGEQHFHTHVKWLIDDFMITMVQCG